MYPTKKENTAVLFQTFKHDNITVKVNLNLKEQGNSCQHPLG